MSINDGKVKLYISKHRNMLVIGVLMGLQVFLSVVLSISLAGHIIWPEHSRAAAGSPMQIAYEGRLTDSSGNALGSTGTLYCYRFSIYDAATSGNKLWPGGTPAQTTATTTDGVFNAIIGAADTLTSSVFDFSTTSTAYLQVDVNQTTSTCGGTWEALSPRQPVLSSAYALQSANVYGALLKTDTVNNRVQVGTGAGAASPVYLGLDVRNAADYVGQTCSTNGLMWYNSATTQALVCNNGIINRLGNAGTTTIAAINTNSGTPASVGTVNFSNSNNVTFGINGNTITASASFAGGAGNTLSFYEPFPFLGSTSLSQFAGSSHLIEPFILPQAISGGFLRFPVSMSLGSTTFTTGAAGYGSQVSQVNTMNVVIYTRGIGANSLSLQSLMSTSVGWTFQISYSGTASTHSVSYNLSYPYDGFTTQNTQMTTNQPAGSSAVNEVPAATSNFQGLRYFDMPFATSLGAGVYYIDIMRNSTTGGGSNINLGISVLGVTQFAASTIAPPALATNLSYQLLPAMGFWSTNAINTTNSLGFTAISAIANNPRFYFQIIKET